MVATRWPAFINATARCMAAVDFPDPPFSPPSTTTCAEPDRFTCINIGYRSRLTPSLQRAHAAVARLSDSKPGLLPGAPSRAGTTQVVHPGPVAVAHVHDQVVNHAGEVKHLLRRPAG